jgi:anthranilate synthase/aminodeoxychorismate synthase-like glutamine amidotransferase
MILIIDNYDSFTYNLYHYILDISSKDILVKRNDKITIEEITKLSPEAIIISPGPCSPNEAGISLDVIKNFYDKVPILGVCLGHQAIAQYFGGEIIKNEPVHGKTDKIFHEQNSILANIPNPFIATRYHSLIVKNEPIKNLIVIAENKDGIIMAIKHQKYKVFGVQFHPESIASEYGHDIIANFLKI